MVAADFCSRASRGIDNRGGIAQDAIMPADFNPFATRFTRPGALDFTFPDGQDAAQLVARLAAQGWWGQIVGPHGSGKSTLLHSLVPALEAAGRRIAWFTQGARERRLPVTPEETSYWDERTQLVVDGYEQVGWFSRQWLKRMCRSRRAGLLVTTHKSVGLPTLWTTQPDAMLLRQLVDRLLTAEQRPFIRDEDVSRCYQRHAGNLREALFALYDLYEQRRRVQS